MKAVSTAKPSYPGLLKMVKKRDVENEEIQVYLSKLKELVPFMPKNRRLSKLEVIQYVIDYICDLQQALEAHPTLDSAAVQSAAAIYTSQPIAPLHRQPFGVLPPNQNLITETASVINSSRPSNLVPSSSDLNSVSC